MENYQTSKSLISEQILAYDKKIIQNNANVESRLDDFKAKVDKAIDETFVNNVKWLNEQKQAFEAHAQNANETLVSVSDKLNESLNEQLRAKEDLVEKKVDLFLKQHNDVWVTKCQKLI